MQNMLRINEIFLVNFFDKLYLFFFFRNNQFLFKRLELTLVFRNEMEHLGIEYCDWPLCVYYGWKKLTQLFFRKLLYEELFFGP